MTTRPWWGLAALVLAGALVAAGCSAGDDDADEGTAAHEAIGPADGVADEGASEDGTGGAGGGEAGDGDGTVALPEGRPIALSRSLVFTAELALEAEDVHRVADRAVAAAEAVGGFAADDRRASGETPSADLVLRVPAPRYSETLQTVTGLGEVVAQSASAQDVTDQVVDLEGRIATARASVERLRGFLDRAATVQDVATLEGELARREADLESLEGRLAVLGDQVQLSTITVSVDLPGEAPDDPGDDGGGGFLGGVRRGWDALVAVTGAILVVIGAVLPFVPLVVLAWAAWRVVERRRRARRAPAVAS